MKNTDSHRNRLTAGLTSGKAAAGPLVPAPVPAPWHTAGSAASDLAGTESGPDETSQMQADISTDMGTLLGLLRQPRPYTVPVNLRGYCWGEPQWAALLDDVLAAASRGRPHFTGTLAYVGDADDTSPVTLIDGQQRLVTVLLLLTVLARILQRAGDGETGMDGGATPVTAEALRSLMVTPAGSGPLQLKVTPYRAHERDTLAWLIGRLDDADLPGPTDPAPAMLEAVAYFEGQVAASEVETIYAGLEQLQVSCLVLKKGTGNLHRMVETLNGC